MQKITLTNDFHNTKVTLNMRSVFPSASQIRKSQKTLCGVFGCTCGNVMGMRGKQTVKITGQDYADGFGLVPRFSV